MSRKNHAYATSATISRVFKTLERAGFKVGTVHIGPDGIIELYSAPGPLPSSPANDFDRMEEQGLI